MRGGEREKVRGTYEEREREKATEREDERD